MSDYDPALDEGLYRIPTKTNDEIDIAIDLQDQFDTVRYSHEFREFIVAHEEAADVTGALRAKRYASSKHMYAGVRLTKDEKIYRKAATRLWSRLRWCQMPAVRRTPEMP